MKSEKFRVAVAQIPPVYMDKEGSINKACQTIEEAGKKSAQLILFSETFIPGYPYWRGTKPISKWTERMVELQKNSIRIPSDDTEVLGDAAREANTYCVIGCNEIDDRAGSCTIYNTLLYMGRDGEVLGRHRKLVPTHEERTVWGRGDAGDLKVFDTDIGNLGGLICYENHMTLLKYTMAILGEEIHCAVWPGWWRMERHPGAKSKVELGETDPTRYCDIDPCIREYAFETQTFVVSASGYLPLEELPEEYADVGFHHASGGCAIVNPAGLYIVDPVLNEEKIIYADLDMDDRRLTKAYFDAVGHYTRWDVVSLNLNQVSWTPLGPKNISLHPPRREVGARELREIAEKFEIDLDKLEALIEELRAGATL